MVRVLGNTWMPIGVGGNFMPGGTSGTSAEYYKCASVTGSDTLSVNIPNNAELSGVYTYNSSTGRYVHTSGAFIFHDGNYWVLVGTDGLYYCQSDEIASGTTPVDATGWKLSSGPMNAIDMTVTIPSTWSGYKAVFDSTAGTWSFEDTVTEGLTYTSVTPVVGFTYSSDGLVRAVLYSGMFYGLIGYYRFNGDVDNAVNQEANGAAQNVIYVEGKNGRAVQFDGSTSQVNLPKIVSVRGCYQASISVWFKINSLGSKNVIYAEENSLGYFYRFGCEVSSDGKVSAFMRNFDSGESSIGIIGETIEFGKWYFLVMEFDALTQSFAMYLNGILVNTKTTTANPIPDTAPARTISVGYFNGTTASDTGVIDGVIDELGIWSRALSNTEVSELYNNGAGKSL